MQAETKPTNSVSPLTALWNYLGKRSTIFIRLTSIIVVLTAWQLYGRQLNPIFMSFPSAIVKAAYNIVFVKPDLGPAWVTSIFAMMVGYSLAAISGIGMGFLMGRNRTVELTLDPYVTMLYATPRVALIPLLILWFGIDFELRVMIVLLSAVFPILINTLGGVKHVDEEYIETGRLYDATQLQIIRTVVIPASLPFIFVGLRLGLASGLIGVIVAEMTASITGLGGLIVAYGNYFQTDKLFVPILSIGFTSLGLTYLLQLAERKALPYKFRKTQE